MFPPKKRSRRWQQLETKSQPRHEVGNSKHLIRTRWTSTEIMSTDLMQDHEAVDRGQLCGIIIRDDIYTEPQ